MDDVTTKLDFAPHLDFSSILTNPILDIAARLWEQDRYEAFRVCYRSMRRIDDLVDHRRAEGTPITIEETRELERSIAEWLKSARETAPEDQFTREFLQTLDRFQIPLWPWERLCRAMIYDLSHNGFVNFRGFLRYTEGAAISPAAVFMHLSGMRQVDGEFCPPTYDIRKAARSLALFSYLVHIMRDFEKDQREGLNYFADDLLRAHGLTAPRLHGLAVSRRTTPELRSLMQRYVALADYYRRRARAMVDQVKPALEPRYQLSLEMIYSLYSQIFERIDPIHGNFTTSALNPPPDAVQARIMKTINDFRLGV